MVLDLRIWGRLCFWFGRFGVLRDRSAEAWRPPLPWSTRSSGCLQAPAGWCGMRLDFVDLGTALFLVWCFWVLRHRSAEAWRPPLLVGAAVAVEG